MKDAGGTVLMEPTDIFDSGRMIIASDPTGAMFGVWQAREHIGAQLANEPGRLELERVPLARARARGRLLRGRVRLRGRGRRTWAAPVPYRMLKVDGRGVAGVSDAQDGEPANWATIFTVASCDDSIARR